MKPNWQLASLHQLCRRWLINQRRNETKLSTSYFNFFGKIALWPISYMEKCLWQRCLWQNYLELVEWCSLGSLGSVVPSVCEHLSLIENLVLRNIGLKKYKWNSSQLLHLVLNQEAAIHLKQWNQNELYWVFMNVLSE